MSDFELLSPYYTVRLFCVLVRLVSKDARKMRGKHEKNTTGSGFYPTYSVLYQHVIKNTRKNARDFFKI